MRTIWKYPIVVTDLQGLTLPTGALPLHVGRDPAGQICIWMMVETEAHRMACDVVIVGTGHPAPGDELSYVGQVVDGPFVWHVFLGRPR